MSNLCLHNPKFESKLVQLADLRALPEPIALGPNHKPVPHAVLIDGLLQEIDRRGYDPIKTQYALGAKGNALFGIIDLKGKHDDRSLALGFRNSVDQSLGIRGVAGSHVFVCDNLALSGSTFAFSRKNTTGLDLGAMIGAGFDKFLQHAEAFDLQIARLQGIALSTDRAKALIYDIFAARIVPVRLLDDVNRFYFDATGAYPEIAENQGNVWGVHNAFTRAMRDLTPARQFSATVSLGAQLTGDAIDGEIIGV